MVASSTLQVLSGPVILAQCFGLLPVVHVNATKKLVDFKWKSWRCFYALILILLLLMNCGLYAASLVKDGEMDFGQLVTQLFFTSAFVTSCLFLLLAREWPKLMHFWAKVDVDMGEVYGFPEGLKRKIILTTCCVVVGAGVEHGFFLSFDIIKLTRKHGNATETANEYFKDHFSYVFLFLPYFTSIGVVMQALNLLCTFTWNYMDLFIMLVSVCLAERFRQVKLRLKKAAEEEVKDIKVWMNIREDYNKLNLLTKMLNKSMGGIIILSFTNNLFIILVQLLNSLEPTDGRIWSRIYFMYSFGFLLLRTSAVLLFGARINTESVEPMFPLLWLPADVYNDEIERILWQIKGDPSYISGKGFFKVQKSMMLSLAGAVASYELIFLQFS